MRGLLLAGCGGLLLVASFPRPTFYLLGFIAFVPLLQATRTRAFHEAFALGWVYGAVFYGLAWRWVLPTIARFQEVSLLNAALFFILFVVYHGAQIGLFAALSTSGRTFAAAVAAAVVASWWVVIEWGFPRVIPWHLGDALAPAPLLRQMADLGGTYLLSFIIVFINALLYSALTPGLRLPGRAGFVSVIVGFLGLVVTYGWMRTSSLESDHSSPPIRVAVVQGAIPSRSDDLDARNEAAWQAYEELTTTAASSGQPGFDLVIWPETTLRVSLRHRSDYIGRLGTLVRDLGSPLLLGALDLDAQAQRELNSAYLISPTEKNDPIELFLPAGRRQRVEHPAATGIVILSSSATCHQPYATCSFPRLLLPTFASAMTPGEELRRQIHSTMVLRYWHRDCNLQRR